MKAEPRSRALHTWKPVAAAVCLLAALLAPGLARAADPAPLATTASGAPIPAATGVSYQPIGHWSADQLNRVLTTDAPAFFGVSPGYSPATNGVTLYRVTYGSVVPEQGNRPITATGLLAIPDTGATRFPLLSYQHGTVYGKEQVPSQPENSPETQLALAQFAGQGYVVIGADYFGMGTTNQATAKEPEGYMVKASHQQATYDMLLASRAVLAALKIDTTKLLLGGWSQGGFVTMAMLEKLEQSGVKVAAAATASAPIDIFVALAGFLNFPRPIDAAWVNSLFILSSFAFENYYGVPGLARALFTDDTYDIARRVYLREKFDPAQVPTDLHKLLRPEYFDADFFARSAYGRLVKETTAYRWIIRSPVRNYYGEQDEVITPGLGQLAMTYQRAIGSGNTRVEAIAAGPTTHRGTYATAIAAWKTWFDAQ